MAFKRLCVYPKDVQIITGRSERYGRLIIEKIKAGLRKKPHQVVTVKELSDYLGIEEDQIKNILID